MYHIVLISEDRTLLKKIYPYLEDTSKYCIHVVPFSMDAAEAFLHFHADIAILDTEVFTPYENILDDFEKNQWNYSVILLCNNNEPQFRSENILTVSKDSITQKLLQDKLNRITSTSETDTAENIEVSLNWHGIHNLTLKDGTYHIICMKSFEKKHPLSQRDIEKLQRQVSPYAKFTVLFHTEDSLGLILNRSELKSDFNFTKISQDIWTVAGNNCAILYKSSINFHNLDRECSELQELECYSYFFNNQTFCFDDIEKSCSFKGEKLLHQQCDRLLNTLLEGEAESAVHIVRELYLHTIKNGISFRNLEYIRMQLNFFLYIFSETSFTFDYNCAEDEMNGILESAVFRNSFKELNKLPEILSKAVIQIYNNYQTNISLEGIARELGRNKIYLNRIYKERFKITVLDTLQYLRLEHAKYYLTNTHVKVAEIAELTGFKDIGYFSKFFHHETGTTALEYRTLKGRARK